jgi:glycine cleavage system transcriptional repressor
MKNQILVTAVGEDRPGIVAQLTEVVAKHGGNLEVSRMALLGGEFAEISLVSVRPDKCNELEAALNALSKNGLTIICKPTAGVSAERFAGHKFYRIALTGADHEGIVHKLSAHSRASRPILLMHLKLEYLCSRCTHRLLCHRRFHMMR